MSQFMRVLRNIDSVRECVQIWVMGTLFIFVLGVVWAGREIYDEWGNA